MSETGSAQGKRARRAFAAAALIILLLSLTGCDTENISPSGEDGGAPVESVMYLYGWSRDAETGDVLAWFTTALPEEVIAEAPCVTRAPVVRDGEFWYTSSYEVRFDAADAAEAALEAAPAELGLTLDNLKIVFVYATMNGRIHSDADMTESGGVNVHFLEVTAYDGEVAFEAWMRSPDSGKWYAVLFGSAAGAVVAALVCVAAARRIKWRKKTT